MAKLSDFFQNGVPSSTTFKAMVPPISVSGNVTNITGFVKGIKVKKASVNDEKKWFLITFEDNEGGTVDKIINYPSEDWSDKRKEMAFRQLFSLAILFGVMKDLEAQIGDDDQPWSVFAQTLGLLIEGKGGDDIYLKLVFKDAEGAEPRYVVGNNNWISSQYQIDKDAENPDSKYKNGVTWITGDYPDKRTFTKVDKVPDDLSTQKMNPAPLDLSALGQL